MSLMAKKNTGKPFEALAKQVFDVLTKDDRLSKVDLDVKLDGADGPRQIDVLVETQIAGLAIRTIIEARDYNLSLIHI